ncbi:MAG: glutamyl-tRNA reductase [Hydrogenophilus sp.]|nr:glutamyl-tRNA reductase [Hydrogenophilus sp.]
MPFYAIGLNHHAAPVGVRERLAVAETELVPLLRKIVAAGVGVREAAVLSTCNRTECYVTAADAERAWEWVCAVRGVDPSGVKEYRFVLSDLQAVRHVFRVAAGLDSMVLGETQIIGQFKGALKAAQEAGTAGKHVQQVMQQALAVTKEVRSTTAIGANVVSMAAAAVRLSERVFGAVSEQAVLFVGAGEMVETCVTHFAAHKPRRLAIVNRTLGRAERLAERFGGAAYPLEHLPELLPQFDTIVASTASPLPLIGLGMVERALKVRRHRPLVMVDLAVPRDIEPEVGGLADVFLYTVDDLAEVVREGRERRAQAVAEAEAIIEARLSDFAAWIASQESVPLIRRLRSHVEAMATAERDRALARVRSGMDPERVIEMLVRSLTNKWLHAPTIFLRDGPEEGRRTVAPWLPVLMGLGEMDETNGDRRETF